MSEPNARAPWNWKSDLSHLVRYATLLQLGFLLTASIWHAVTLTPPTILRLMFFAGFILGEMLFLVNAAFVGFARGYRLVHAAFTSLMLAAFAFSFWTSGLHVEYRRRWFVQEECKAYEVMAQKIMLNKPTLTDKARRLDDLVNYPDGAFGKTNADGSVTIWFRGLEGSPRRGHLYHSGGLLTESPNDSSEYFHHLTNGWYEY